MGRTKRQHAAGGGAAGRSLNTEEEKMSNKGMGVSRRNFLKGAALAGAATAGAPPRSRAALRAARATLPPTGCRLRGTTRPNVLVIGYGGAGMWASLIAADECQQKVLVLEKAPVEGGGNSRINNGEWTIIEEDKKELFADYIRAFTHGKTPDDMIDAWVNEAVRNTEYADKYGMTYEVVEQALAGAIPEYWFPRRRQVRGCLQAVLRGRLRHAHFPRA